MNIEFQRGNDFVSGFKLGDYEVMPDRNAVINKGSTIHLEPKIMDVCYCLAQNCGKVVSREQLINAVWKTDLGSDESLTRAISLLRKTFSQSGSNEVNIETIPKRGYRLVDKVAPLAGSAQKVVHNRKRRLADKMTKSREAYDLYLQGKALNTRIFGDGVLEQAVKDLIEAVRLDPNFVEAWTELSRAYLQIAIYNSVDNWREVLEKSDKAAQRAINIRPLCGLPTCFLSWSPMIGGDISNAIRLAEKAYHCDPKNSDIAMRLGSLLAMIGRTNDALPLLQKAVYMDPTQGRNHMMLAIALLNNGDTAGADKHSQRAHDLRFDVAFITHHISAHIAGNNDLAIERCLEKVKNSGTTDKLGSRDTWAKVADVTYGGNNGQRPNMLREIEAIAKDTQSICKVEYLSVLILTGSADKFFEGFCASGAPITYLTLMYLWLRCEPMGLIRQHPDFISFAKQIGMLDAWETYGYPDKWNGKSFDL